MRGVSVRIIQLTGRERCVNPVCLSRDPTRTFLEWAGEIDGQVETDYRDGVITIHDRLILCSECVHSAWLTLPEQVSAIDGLQVRALEAEHAAVQWREKFEAERQVSALPTPVELPGDDLSKQQRAQRARRARERVSA